MRDPGGGLTAPGLRSATAGAFALGFLSAFEALAVTAAMPLAAADLHGRPLFPFAFSAFAAAGVVGMVLAGSWSDRVGPARPLVAAVSMFAAGLVIAGSAPSMGVLIAGRAVQGLGSGAMGVALYVLVAAVYPPRLHPRMFALLAAAWVLPSLVGPAAAGWVAATWSWHWVFLGIVPLVAVATAVLAPTLRRLPPGDGRPAQRVLGPRIGWAALAAVALLAMQPALGVPVGGVGLALAAAVVAVVAVRRLLPAGVLTARRGLPAVLAARALFSGGFAMAEAYLPYALITLRHIPAAFAGAALTVGAVSWAAGSAVQGRFPEVLTDRRCLVIGSASFAGGLIVTGATLLAGAPVPAVLAGWLATGLGIGLAYPRLSARTLALSARAEQGRNSAALSIADGFGNGLALTLVGVATAVAGADRPFVAAFGLAMGTGIVVLPVAPRAAAGEEVRVATTPRVR